MSQVKAKHAVVVKMSAAVSWVVATAKGGLGLVEAFAQRFGLWSDCERLLPQRRDPSQGFTTTAVVSAFFKASAAWRAPWISATRGWTRCA